MTSKLRILLILSVIAVLFIGFASTIGFAAEHKHRGTSTSKEVYVGQGRYGCEGSACRHTESTRRYLNDETTRVKTLERQLERERLRSVR